LALPDSVHRFFSRALGTSVYLDRIWPTTTELLKERGEEIKQDDIPISAACGAD